MAVSRLKTWVAGEILTAADLNAEFNNILNNAQDLASPRTKNLDMDGFSLILDADADTSITADTDDRIDFNCGGTDVLQLSTTGVALPADDPILDSNNNELVEWTATASAVNNVCVTNNSTGNPPIIESCGLDTNVPLSLRGKGNGSIQLGGASSTGVVLLADQPIRDAAGNELIEFTSNASAINHIGVTNTATSNHPQVSAVGGDTNINLNLVSKGIGIVQANGTGVVPVKMASQATTSGNTFDFTNIPSWVTHIIVSVSAVSFDSTDHLLVQIGDSGGVETSTYSSVSCVMGDASATVAVSATNGFIVYMSSAGNTMSGHLMLNLHTTSDAWVQSHSFRRATTSVCTGGGHKTLSGTLTTVRVTRSGSGSFDNGSVAVWYQ